MRVVRPGSAASRGVRQAPSTSSTDRAPNRKPCTIIAQAFSTSLLGVILPLEGYTCCYLCLTACCNVVALLQEPDTTGALPLYSAACAQVEDQKVRDCKLVWQSLT